MRISISAQVAYGVRVCNNIYDELDWDRRERIECELRGENHKIELMPAGAYDGQMCFLVIKETWNALEPGQVQYVGPYLASSNDNGKVGNCLNHVCQQIAARNDAQVRGAFCRHGHQIVEKVPAEHTCNEVKDRE
ncbi:hypothetical protein ABT282_08100 [Streptomyces sp. NPDC000927]|uniref:hypothetical protein n=1 Tax=Streptomyces sp. NPDC000927 TaxID=3154371 RepID=UPI00331B9209